jgi:hypothetical protein
MAFRFRRSIKLLPGVRLNVSKSGITTSIGTKGATVKVGGKAGPKATVGLSGSGLSYTEHLHHGLFPGQQPTGGIGVGTLLLLGLVALIGYLVIFGGR